MANTYATAPSASNVSLGRGKILFDRLDANGVRTGFIHLGNCDTFSASVAVETKELADFTTNTSAPYKQVNTKTTADIKIAGFEFSPDILALNVLGDVSAVTQSSATVTAEALASATQTKKGRIYRTAKRNISAVAVKQGATTFVLGTDYTILDATMGLISFPSTSTVVDATAVTIDYTAAAIVSTDGIKKIVGATNSKIEGVLTFVPDPAAGPSMEVVVYRANLAPDGELSWISEDFNKWSVSGSAQSDVAGSYGGSAGSPYFEIVER